MKMTQSILAHCRLLPMQTETTLNAVDNHFKQRKEHTMTDKAIKQLVAAIEAAMEDHLENGAFTPHNPAIIYDGKRYYYGSTLIEQEVKVIFDLADGFGWHTPGDKSDIPYCADALAFAIEKELG